MLRNYDGVQLTAATESISTRCFRGVDSSRRSKRLPKSGMIFDSSHVNDPAHGGTGLVSVLDLYPAISWCEVYPQLGVLGPDFRAY